MDEGDDTMSVRTVLLRWRYPRYDSVCPSQTDTILFEAGKRPANFANRTYLSEEVWTTLEGRCGYAMMIQKATTVVKGVNRGSGGERGDGGW